MAETSITKPEGAVKTIKDYLMQQDVQARMKAMLPTYLTPERHIAIALTTIKGNSGLLECSPLSLAACVVQAAELHLSLDPALGHAYMVKFKSKHTSQPNAQLIVGYKGFIDLAYRSGSVDYITAEIVREGELFHIHLGTNRHIEHDPAIRKRGEPEPRWIGAYATADLRSGKTVFDFMDEDDIARIRSRSRAADSGPWVTDTEAMHRKTVIRRLAKFLPVSVTDNRLLRAAVIDEAQDQGLITSRVLRPEELSQGLDALTFAPDEGAKNSDSVATPGHDGASDAQPAQGQAAGSEEEIHRYRVKELGKALGYNEAKVNMLLGEHRGKLPALIEQLQKQQAIGPQEKVSGKESRRFSF